MTAVAKTHHRLREPAAATSKSLSRADQARPELARQVGALAEANARLDTRVRALATAHA